MNENRTKSWLYIVIVLAVSAMAVYFQTILNIHYLDAETGMYQYGAKTPGAFYFFIGVAAALMLTPFFTMRRDCLPKELKCGSILTRLVSVGCACAVIFTAITVFMTPGGLLASADNATSAKMEKICAFLAFPTAIYYFTAAFSSKSKTNLITFLSFFPMLWSLVYLMSIYFDHSVFINSPVRVIRQLAVILLMVYQLYETRALLGKSVPLVYFVVSNLTVIIISAAYLPECISILNGGARLDNETVYTLFFALAGVYVLTRSMSFAMRSDGTEPSWSKIFVNRKPLKDDIFEVSDEEDTED